jgi:FSR family fosmidomycin resistance protein-like MFS transporter
LSLLLDPSFLAAALAHFAVDLLNSQRPVLLAYLSVPLGLTNTLIGFISLVYTFSASLSQPIFGWLSDRVGARWVAAGGVLWMAGVFALAVVAPGKAVLVLLVLAALGSGAFHPAGTVEATETGRVHFAGRETTAASFFFLFGQVGYSVGPALGGPIVGGWGPSGLIVLAPLAAASGLFAARHLTLTKPHRSEAGAPTPTWKPTVGWRILVPFILLTAFRSWSQTNLMTFLPKYYSDAGFAPAAYGVLAGLFMAGSALGGVYGAWLADRWSQRSVAVGSLLLGGIPLALYPWLGLTGWAPVLSFASGALTGATHSIIVVEAQRMLPGQMGVASGLVLGFTFASGSLGTVLSGLQADAFGFSPMFTSTAIITVLAGLLSLALRERPLAMAAQPTGAAALSDHISAGD